MDNAVEAARALAYLRDNQAESPGSYQWALARANDVETGVRLLVARLKDPRQRTDALADVQDYAQVAEPARAAQWTANFRAVVLRPEVQRAVSKVGRIEHYNIVALN